MDKPHSENPRARLQALLAIPDRQRTDEEWDELNELEIMLAVGNREVIPGQSPRRDGPPPGGGGGQSRPNRGPDGKQPQRKMHNRPPKRKGPR